MAQQAGFTVAEIQTLLHDFPSDTPPSVRWKVLATRKLVEINALIERANAMKKLLEQALECQCVELEACIQVTECADSDELEIKMCCGIDGN